MYIVHTPNIERNRSQFVNLQLNLNAWELFGMYKVCDIPRK